MKYSGKGNDTQFCLIKIHLLHNFINSLIYPPAVSPQRFSSYNSKVSVQVMPMTANTYGENFFNIFHCIIRKSRSIILRTILANERSKKSWQPLWFKQHTMVHVLSSLHSRCLLYLYFHPHALVLGFHRRCRRFNAPHNTRDITETRFPCR